VLSNSKCVTGKMEDLGATKFLNDPGQVCLVVNQQDTFIELCRHVACFL